MLERSGYTIGKCEKQRAQRAFVKSGLKIESHIVSSYCLFMLALFI